MTKLFRNISRFLVIMIIFTSLPFSEFAYAKQYSEPSISQLKLKPDFGDEDTEIFLSGNGLRDDFDIHFLKDEDGEPSVEPCKANKAVKIGKMTHGKIKFKVPKGIKESGDYHIMIVNEAENCQKLIGKRFKFKKKKTEDVSTEKKLEGVKVLKGNEYTETEYLLINDFKIEEKKEKQEGKKKDKNKEDEEKPVKIDESANFRIVKKGIKEDFENKRIKGLRLVRDDGKVDVTIPNNSKTMKIEYGEPDQEDEDDEDDIVEIEEAELRVKLDEESKKELSKGLDYTDHKKTAAGDYKIYLVKEEIIKEKETKKDKEEDKEVNDSCDKEDKNKKEDGKKENKKEEDEEKEEKIIKKIVYEDLKIISMNENLDEEEDDDKEKEEYVLKDKLKVRDKPWIESVYPKNGDRYFSAERLYRRFGNKEDGYQEGYFIEINFHNLGGLKLLSRKTDSYNSKDLEEDKIEKNSIIAGGVSLKDERNQELVANAQPILKGSTVYIKLKDVPKDGMEYKLTIEDSALVEYEGFDDVGYGKFNVGSANKNKEYKSTFKTEDLPEVETIYEGSVAEDYDYKYPIVIDGTKFNRKTEVYFEDASGYITWADYVRYESLDEEIKRLYVYLPRDRDKLETGKYTMVIKNGRDFVNEMEYGLFSVVPRGEYIPEEKLVGKIETEYGDMESLSLISKNVLKIEDVNRYQITIDLDKVMGKNTSTKVIEYLPKYNQKIGLLRLESEKTNIDFRNVVQSGSSNKDKVRIQIGKAEPFVEKKIRDQAFDTIIKSEMIDISGNNYKFDEVEISIPYSSELGSDRCRMLRYDEVTRRFEDVTMDIDYINNKVIGRSRKPGVFFIAE